MLELDACIGRCEPPVDPSAFGVAALFPRRHLLLQRLTVGDSSVQTLTAQHAQLDLGHARARFANGHLVERPGESGGEAQAV